MVTSAPGATAASALAFPPAPLPLLLLPARLLPRGENAVSPQEAGPFGRTAASLDSAAAVPFQLSKNDPRRRSRLDEPLEPLHQQPGVIDVVRGHEQRV